MTRTERKKKGKGPPVCHYLLIAVRRRSCPPGLHRNANSMCSTPRELRDDVKAVLSECPSAQYRHSGSGTEPLEKRGAGHAGDGRVPLGRKEARLHSAD